MRFSLLRRQQLWIPTVWGWLVLLVVSVAACVIAGRYIHMFLAQNDPVPQARTLVIEGWMTGEELDQAAAAFRMGGTSELSLQVGRSRVGLNSVETRTTRTGQRAISRRTGS